MANPPNTFRQVWPQHPGQRWGPPELRPDQPVWAACPLLNYCSGGLRGLEQGSTVFSVKDIESLFLSLGPYMLCHHYSTLLQILCKQRDTAVCR